MAVLPFMLFLLINKSCSFYILFSCSQSFSVSDQSKRFKSSGSPPQNTHTCSPIKLKEKQQTPSSALICPLFTVVIHHPHPPTHTHVHPLSPTCYVVNWPLLGGYKTVQTHC